NRRDMARRLGIFVALLGCLLTGCEGTAMPRLRDPGDLREQSARAQVFDPFPEKGIGPSIDGGRPLGFQNPRDEYARMQAEQYQWRPQRGGVQVQPLPPTYPAQNVPMGVVPQNQPLPVPPGSPTYPPGMPSSQQGPPPIPYVNLSM